MTYSVQDIPITSIHKGENDRVHFDQTALEELAASIKEHGLAQPITLRPHAGGYQIVAGERRFRAISEVLKLDTIPAIVRELSDEEASAIMLVENTSRVDLDPIAEAKAYQVRVERFSWSPSKIAATAGVSVPRVRGRLKLLELPEDIQHYVRTNNFPLGHAQWLADSDLDTNRQRIALRVYNSALSMSLRQFKEMVYKLLDEQAAESQMNMFEMELMLIQEVNLTNLPTKGKKAVTGAPVNRSLPIVTVNNDDSVGAILDRYICDLLKVGQKEIAGALGNVYNALVAGNWTSIPANSTLHTSQLT